MVTKPTVLVLGAGASSHYGFPLGGVLLDRVCGIVRGDTTFTAIVDAGFAETEVEEFIGKLADSAYGSVDWFLEEWTEYIPVGKAAIAAILIPMEDPYRLRPPSATEAQHWYRDLLNVLDSDPARFKENKLSVITFNYDRSLEHFLWTALRTRRIKSTGDEQAGLTLAREDLEAVEIVHVHGSLGAYPTLESEGRPYTPSLDGTTVEQAAMDIYVVGEVKHDAHGFKTARDLLGSATKILFLGFGFHEASVGRLGVFEEPWDHMRRYKTYVSGTLKGISAPRISTLVTETLNGAFVVPRSPGGDICHFLREDHALDWFPELEDIVLPNDLTRAPPNPV